MTKTGGTEIVRFAELALQLAAVCVVAGRDALEDAVHELRQGGKRRGEGDGDGGGLGVRGGRAKRETFEARVA